MGMFRFAVKVVDTFLKYKILNECDTYKWIYNIKMLL